MLLALGLFLASIHLGPETSIGTRATGAAAATQDSPAAAWNGRTGLAVWTDDRGTYPTESYPPRLYVEPMLRVSPMRADGSLVHPDGTPLFPATDPRIASNGTSFMLAYRDAKGTHVVPLDENGSPHGPNTLIPDYTYDFDIISNGHTFFFVTSTGTAVEALVFAPDGSPYALKKLDTGTY